MNLCCNKREKSEKSSFIKCTKHLCQFEHVEEIANKESYEASGKEDSHHTYGDTDCHFFTYKY